MPSSSNSTAERIKQLSEAYKSGAKEIVANSLRDAQASLDYWKTEAIAFKSLSDVQLGTIEVLIKFITEAQVEPTPEVAAIIAQHMECILLRTRGGTNV